MGDRGDDGGVSLVLVLVRDPRPLDILFIPIEP
jgi:hypothetical protein